MNTLLRTAGAVAVLLAAALAPANAAPADAARAGGWAVTYLDPLPERIEPGKAYTAGFWVLQHGDHPPDPEEMVDEAGLELTNEKGDRLTFRGVRLREKAHWAAALAVPEGSWKVTGLQGDFEPHEVGTLTVPGGVKIKKLEQGRGGPAHDDATEHWDAIRPPIEDGHTHAAAPEPAEATPAARRPAEITTWLYAGGAALAAAGGVLLLRRRVNRTTPLSRTTPPPES